MIETLVTCDATKLTELVNEALAANIPASEIDNIFRAQPSTDIFLDTGVIFH